MFAHGFALLGHLRFWMGLQYAQMEWAWTSDSEKHTEKLNRTHTHLGFRFCDFPWLTTKGFSVSKRIIQRTLWAHCLSLYVQPNWLWRERWNDREEEGHDRDPVARGWVEVSGSLMIDKMVSTSWAEGRLYTRKWMNFWAGWNKIPPKNNNSIGTPLSNTPDSLGSQFFQKICHRQSAVTFETFCHELFHKGCE